MIERDVYGLYGESWQNEIVPDAFAHPAKFGRALIRWIYQHCMAQGYIHPCDSIVDPFGGVGLGGLDAMRNGLHWHGVELEQKFVDLGNQNIALWNERYSQWFSGWGTAQLIQGDSRNLASILSGQVGAAVVSSPPYASGEKGHPSLGSVNKDDWGRDGRDIAGRRGLNGEYGKAAGQMAEMPEGDHADAVVSSPPFSGDKNLMPNNNQGVRSDMVASGQPPESQTQQSLGNLATLRANDEGYQAAISSPPYADAVSGNGEGPGARHDTKHHKGENSFKKSSDAEYGTSPGNLGNMAACVSSPPFEGVLGKPHQDPETKLLRPLLPDTGNVSNYLQQARKAKGLKQKEVSRHFPSQTGGLTGCVSNWELGYNMPTPEQWLKLKELLDLDDRFDKGILTVEEVQATGINTTNNLGTIHGANYGEHPDNIGNDQGETFWTAARAIVEQVYAVLKPGGYAVWVTKNFVRNKQRVEFSDQWQALCEACGFVPVERIRAWVVEDRGNAVSLFDMPDTSARMERLDGSVIEVDGRALDTNEVVHNDGRKVKNATVQRKSFFRLLAEKKGSPRIDYEDVIILRKPE